MRNLTLGALIVIGGILAALPFRRAPDANRPAAAELSMATGPPGSFAATDDPLTLDQWFTGPTSSSEQMAVHSQAGLPTSLASAMRSPNALRGIPSDAQARPRRDLRVPLTYEDLAVPWVTPEYSDGRFDALASRQEMQRSAEAQRNASLNVDAEAAQDRRAFEAIKVDVRTQSERPERRAPWEMARDLPQSILEPQPQQSTRLPESPLGTPVAAPTAAPTSSVAPGRLAGNSQPGRQAGPTGSEPDRPRHWIRQPE